MTTARNTTVSQIRAIRFTFAHHLALRTWVPSTLKACLEADRMWARLLGGDEQAIRHYADRLEDMQRNMHAASEPGDAYDMAYIEAQLEDDVLLHFAGYSQPGESADPLLGPSGQATPTDGFLSFTMAKLDQEPLQGPRLSWEAHVYGRRSYDAVDRGDDGYGSAS